LPLFLINFCKGKAFSNIEEVRFLMVVNLGMWDFIKKSGLLPFALPRFYKLSVTAKY
jgi:hypothetical protein